MLMRRSKPIAYDPTLPGNLCLLIALYFFQESTSVRHHRVNTAARARTGWLLRAVSVSAATWGNFAKQVAKYQSHVNTTTLLDV